MFSAKKYFCMHHKNTMIDTDIHVCMFSATNNVYEGVRVLFHIPRKELALVIRDQYIG